MFRSLLIFGLASSLMAVCQTPSGVTVNGGYVAPAMPGPPLLTPPNAALPGSGPATGAPPAIGVNDARYGGAGSVFEPSSGTLTGSALPATPAPTVVTGASNTTASENGVSQPFATGMGEFAGLPTNQPETSLADIARKYKAERAAKHPRQFDNNSVRHANYGTADSNSANLPQSDQTPDQASATYGSTGNTSVPEGVKSSSDYAAVQAALARSQAAENVNATDNTVATAMPDPNRSAYEAQDSSAQSANANPQQGTTASNTNQATTPQVDTQANADNAPAKNKQLPASASDLPLFAFLGLVALAAGGLFTRRTRRSPVRL
jgi:hypothetical protein